MRATDRSLDIFGFIAEHFRDIIRRRLSELAGLALMALALLGALALATWSVQDPSLSHATQKPIHNLLGYPGAIFSDLAMQLLGLAAIMLLAPEKDSLTNPIRPLGSEAETPPATRTGAARRRFHSSALNSFLPAMLLPSFKF